MIYLLAIILGLIQALTEFLPVSSSGHLILARGVLDFGFVDGLTFDVGLHVDDDIQLIVKDDGQGFDARGEHSGMGLQSMKERAESLDGTFTVDSELGEGTRISVTLPVGP